jgi:hypothetical protein
MPVQYLNRFYRSPEHPYFWKLLLVIIPLLCVNLTSCGTDPEFEALVKQDWEEAFQVAQAEPCSLEGSSIRNATDRDPRFEQWAIEHPLSDCPERTYSGGSADCGGYDDEGNYIEQTCEEAIASKVRDPNDYPWG